MGSIAIVGVGLEPDAVLTEATLSRLRQADRVVIASGTGAVAEALAGAGIEFSALTELGVPADAPIEFVIDRLGALSSSQDVAFATSGYPFMRSGLLSGLLARDGSTVDVFPTLSPFQVVLMAFDVDITADLDIVDARSLDPQAGQRDSHLVVTGVSTPELARRVAARLGAFYAPTHRLFVADTRGADGFSLATIALAELPDIGTTESTALYVPPRNIDPPAGFTEFVRIIGVLRGPDGCPWDKAQDHLSLRRHMIEEAHEAVAAIETGGDAELADELGDVLLQVVLHAQIASEDGRFTIDDVIGNISRKIRRRHPHIFGDARADTPEEVITNWDAIKRAEKAEAGLLDGVPRSLPALMLAQKISRRVVGVGFEWESIDAVWDKVHEEIDELKATEPGSPEAAEEIGDLLFTIVNLARKQGIDAEEALRGTCAKFTRRWESMERVARLRGESIEDIGTEGLEELWAQAKNEESR